MKVTFWGVRGSYPCPGAAWQRYGGNTACVALEVPGEPPLLLDMGTGLVAFGAGQPQDGTFRASALVSHAHWDHIQGLPYFAPINSSGAVLDVYGPPEEDLSLSEVFDRHVAPPVFPVSWNDLYGSILFHDTFAGDRLAIGAYSVEVGRVPHPGTTLGYRVEANGKAVAYISDHQMPADRTFVDENVVELAKGVDLLIHDAQYTNEEFDAKPDWGHCTVDYAVHVALTTGARRLALFHHDPAHGDDALDDLLSDLRTAALSSPTSVFAAREGDVVAL